MLYWYPMVTFLHMYLCAIYAYVSLAIPAQMFSASHSLACL